MPRSAAGYPASRGARRFRGPSLSPSERRVRYSWVTTGSRRARWVALAESMDVSLALALDWVFDAGMARLADGEAPRLP